MGSRANDTLRNTFLIPVDASSHTRYHWRICNRISHRRISVVKPRAFCEIPCDPYHYKWAPFARAPTVWRDEYTLESTVRARLLAMRFIFAVALVHRRRDPCNLRKCSNCVKFPLKFARVIWLRVCNSLNYNNYVTILHLTIGCPGNNTYLVWIFRQIHKLFLQKYLSFYFNCLILIF